jgi:hypothetical protein
VVFREVNVGVGHVVPLQRLAGADDIGQDIEQSCSRKVGKHEQQAGAHQVGLKDLEVAGGRPIHFIEPEVHHPSRGVDNGREVDMRVEQAVEGGGKASALVVRLLANGA